MFLARRATEPEYFDQPDRCADDLATGYRHLARINKFTRFAEPFQRLWPAWLGEEACRNLAILDLGAGDGALGRELTAWAAQQGWTWRFTDVDMNVPALRLNSGRAKVAASVLALPFADASFDVVIATQMTHHLTDDAEVVRHFREAWRVARTGVFIYDLHRRYPMYFMTALMLLFMRVPGHFFNDGMLSVRRGWRVDEWQRLAAEAGMGSAEVRTDFYARVLLQARKKTPAPAGGALSADHGAGDRGLVKEPALAGGRP